MLLILILFDWKWVLLNDVITEKKSNRCDIKVIPECVGRTFP